MKASSLFVAVAVAAERFDFGEDILGSHEFLRPHGFVTRSQTRTVTNWGLAVVKGATTCDFTVSVMVLPSSVAEISWT